MVSERASDQDLARMERSNKRVFFFVPFNFFLLKMFFFILCFPFFHASFAVLIFLLLWCDLTQASTLF